MPWVMLDDQFADHPKVMAAGPLASWLYICGLTYCARYLTDGFIPAAQVRKLADVENASALACRLVDADLWHETEGGYLVHDYLNYNPSAEKVRADRAAAKARMAQSRSQEVRPNIKGTPREVRLPRTPTRTPTQTHTPERERARARADTHARTHAREADAADAADTALSLSQKAVASEPEAEQILAQADVALAEVKAYDAVHAACVTALKWAPKSVRERDEWREGVTLLLAEQETPATIPKLVRQWRAKVGDQVKCSPLILYNHLGELRGTNYAQYSNGPHSAHHGNGLNEQGRALSEEAASLANYRAKADVVREVFGRAAPD
ncbi:MAG TPA: hypothetical protein VF916_09970 [Ktedonobacterales bacterium]